MAFPKKQAAPDPAQAAAAKHKSAASVAHNDPDAAPGDADAHAMHGAKLLSAIADAHVQHLSEQAEKKKQPPKGKKPDAAG